MIINKILKVLKNNLFIIFCIIFLILVFAIIKINYMDFVNKIDLNIHNFFVEKVINGKGTEFMKDVTYLGSTICVIFIFILCLFLFRNKIINTVFSLNLLFLLLLRTSLKNTFKRPRPIYSLIKVPTDYSFPSGHTLFAVGFYGLIIYFIWKTNISKFYKYILTFVISMLIIFIGISRIYLGVHYFSDVIGGLILGILSLILFINIYKKYDWGYKK